MHQPLPTPCTAPPSAHPSAAAPSAWITRWHHLLPARCTVLDVACGAGRHVQWLSQRGHAVTGVDRDAAALAGLQHCAEVVWADIENAPWPLPGRQFDAVVVTNYLWRPLWSAIVGSVAPGGVLLYETFGHGNAAFGKPARADFLLTPGELLQVCSGWHVAAYECGQLSAPDRVVQRIAAIRPADTGPAPLPHL